MRMIAACVGAAIFSASTFARADDDGCKLAPSLTPARDTVADLRCFPQRIASRTSSSDSGRASPLSIVMASVGGAGIATFIGFGLAGSSQFGNGNVPTSTIDSVRVDYAVANVALSIGVTALVTGIVLLLTHH